MVLQNILNEQVWCPQCNGYAQILKISKAAKLADVSRRTIYRYMEEGKVNCFKVAGTTMRVCGGCLIKIDELSAVRFREK